MPRSLPRTAASCDSAFWFSQYSTAAFVLYVEQSRLASPPPMAMAAAAGAASLGSDRRTSFCGVRALSVTSRREKAAARRAAGAPGR
eukprot:3437364-Prymnesium_polylepis.3